MSGSRDSKWRWRVANLMNRLPGQCWADLVSWALGWNKARMESRLPWRPVIDACRRDAAECGTCYCGKIRGGAS